MKNPEICVIIPSLNSARYIAEAIESILSQTYQNFHLVVLDGGSSDPTIDIVKGYIAKSSQVSLEICPNMHPCARIDRFLKTSSSRYIALQHSDDISYEQRLKKQRDAFVDKPDLGVCSAFYRSFWHDRCNVPRSEGATVFVKPASHQEIKANLPFWYVMHSPTLMMDREKIVKAGLNFKNQYNFCNDYWQTVLNIDRLSYFNVQEELSAYRLHSKGDGSLNCVKLNNEQLEVKANILRHFGFHFTENELEMHNRIKLFPDEIVDVKNSIECKRLLNWLANLKEQNEQIGAFEPAIFNHILNQIRIKTKAIAWLVEENSNSIVALPASCDDIILFQKSVDDYLAGCFCKREDQKTPELKPEQRNPGFFRAFEYKIRKVRKKMMLKLGSQKRSGNEYLQ